MAEGRVIAAGDYLDGEFQHLEHTDEMARATGIGDLIVAPIIGDDGPLGAIEVYRRERHAFDDIDAAVLGGLADQAAIAITNARLIEELERSQAAVARRADTERALRDITARIAALREPDVILDRVVEEARRLLGTDGAHLTRMAEDGTYLVPVVVAGATDPETQRWLLGMRFPLGGGINGLAAETGVPVWTEDYTADPRIPHEGERRRGRGAARAVRDGGRAAARPGRRGHRHARDLDRAAAHVRRRGARPPPGPRRPGRHRHHQLDPAAAPDRIRGALPVPRRELAGRRVLDRRRGQLHVHVRRDGTGVRLAPEEVIGGHFSRVVDPASHPAAVARWSALVADPAAEQIANMELRSPDGRLIPVEVSAIGIVDAEGTFLGIHGSTRDISERDRLERELRASEERYRYLVASSPDLVWLTDADGTLTFLSDATRTMLGVEPDELIGRPYSEIFAPEARRDASVRFRWLARHPSAVHRMRLPFRHADGRDVMVEINGTGMTSEGRFIGAHGAARDVSERDRLERDLRRQAGELAAGEERAHLARELHDSVTQALFSMTLVSRSVELLLDRDVGGRPWTARPAARPAARGAGRDARAHLRAPARQPRAGRAGSRAADPHGGAPGPDRAADRGRERARRPAAAGDRGGPVPDLPGGAPQRRQARRRPPGPRSRWGGRRRGVRLNVHDDGKGFDPTRVPDGHLGLAGMRARADKIGATFTVGASPARARRSRSSSRTSAIAAGGAAPIVRRTVADPRRMT